MRTRFLLTVAIMLGGLLMAEPLYATDVGHYVPGVVNIRDFVVPPPGLYYEQFNLYYHTDEFKNRNGDSVDTVTIDGTTINLDIDVDVFAIVPTFVWVSNFKLLGASYAAFISPAFQSTSVDAALSIRDQGVEVDDSNFGFGDLFVMPIWLGWHWPRFDLAAGYGFYAPTGRYEGGESDNIGLGFWTHQFQASGIFYVTANKAKAVMLTTTYEIHGDKEDTDLTPGDNFTLEWGISQYLSERFELGIAGYSSWQVENDSGSAFRLDRGVKDQVHAAGLQVSYWVLKDRLNLAARYLREFEARDRFEGQLATLTLTYVIWAKQG